MGIQTPNISFPTLVIVSIEYFLLVAVSKKMIPNVPNSAKNTTIPYPMLWIASMLMQIRGTTFAQPALHAFADPRSPSAPFPTDALSELASLLRELLQVLR